jgi:hypothetical protein
MAFLLSDAGEARGERDGRDEIGVPSPAAIKARQLAERGMHGDDAGVARQDWTADA